MPRKARVEFPGAVYHLLDRAKRFFYDARGREDYHTWDGDAAPGIDRTWDNASRLTSISNAVSTIEYTYDQAGQVRTERNIVNGAGGAAQTTYYRYPDGSAAHIGYPDGTWVRHDYTARGQLKAVYENVGGYWKQPVVYHYLPDGKVASQNSRPGVLTEFEYDGRGFTSSIKHSRPGAELSRRNYYRDERDRIRAWQKGSANQTNPLEDGRGDHYWYDAEGQLTDAYYGAIDPVTNPHNPVRIDYFAYDALGNRMGWNHLASRGEMTFERKNNGLNQYRGWWNYSIINYDDDLAGWGAPGAANGVLMQDGWITAGFNALNQPMYIWSANVGWTNFGFDPLGRCVKRWTDGGAPTYLYYDGWNLIQEGATFSNAARLYFHGARVDEIVASYNESTDMMAYHYYDASGHATLLTDWQGNLLEQYSYDAFGKPYFHTAATGWNSDAGSSPHGNRFLFTGREWLGELKLYDYRNRMYQPELGRFLQPDPKHFAAGDYNLYRYCHNDPINKTDPFGLVPPGEGLMDLPRKTLQEMKEAMKDNIKRTLTEKSPDGPGGKPRPQEHRTTAYDNGKGERRTSSETGYHKNNQPMTDLPKNPFGKEPATPAWDTHSHISGSGKPINNDRPAADSMRVPSGIQSATGGPLYIYVPSATRGGEGGLFRVEGNRLINDATGQEAPH